MAVMKSWKVLIGLAGACAACCAIPLIGGTAAVAATAGGLLACAAECVPAALTLAGVALLGALSWWIVRRLQRNAACACPTGTAGKGERHGDA
jgi:hypothetical protein